MIDNERNSSDEVRINTLKNISIMYEITWICHVSFNLFLWCTFDFFETQIKCRWKNKIKWYKEFFQSFQNGRK